MDSGYIQDMAVVERPRERLQSLGPEALKDDELLALMLGTGTRGRGVMDVSRDLLAKYSLPSLLALSIDQLRQEPGLGLGKSAALIAAVELVRRSLGRDDPARTRAQTVQDVLGQAIEIRDKKKEYLLAFFFNARQQLIAKEIISIGTLTASLAHPREIFAPAIGKAAAGIILVHNHPSGDPSPSDEDTRLTQRILHAGRILGIDLLDHLIVAEKGSYSFKTSGGIL